MKNIARTKQQTTNKLHSVCLVHELILSRGPQEGCGELLMSKRFYLSSLEKVAELSRNYYTDLLYTACMAHASLGYLATSDFMVKL